MSVRKRTWSTKGAERSAWVVDYVDSAGKRRLKSFKLKKDADRFSATASVEVREGTHVADSASVTVAVAGDLWIATAEANGLERTTVANYRSHVDLHIVPFIGTMKLTALTVPALRAFEDQLRREGRSVLTVRKVVVSVGSLLADAQERGLVARNVVRDMRGRRSSDRRQEQRQKGRLKIGLDIPTREEIKAVVGAAEGRWRPLLLTAIFCGLRPSELRGLRWQDVDLQKSEIRVHQRADRFNAIGKPKSISGERSIPAPPIVVNILREWRLACPKGKLDLVFPNGAGNVESLKNIATRGLHPTMIRAGVAVETGKVDAEGKAILAARYTGMHCLRHFNASWLINRKEDGGLALPPKVVQERLGHSTITMTMDTYGHLFPRGDDADELAAAELALLG
ncbi:tyrosine-type recombinase/integrase [Aurantimonas endophytica]|uniref:Integrase n=1 Tax=Aurantimonas endophytica TaxID=1522175 RepID=A0A7W6HDJ2_9HYPH|nr:site-specific integrase [Aurantimonas endophytica]MBB4003239.1 integrase [Aurantimonas endophytica]MCO6404101.1 tyrosine-type recombinase/integrase [Aurantimonas endophytica]